MPEVNELPNKESMKQPTKKAPRDKRTDESPEANLNKRFVEDRPEMKVVSQAPGVPLEKLDRFMYSSRAGAGIPVYLIEGGVDFEHEEFTKPRDRGGLMGRHRVLESRANTYGSLFLKANWRTWMAWVPVLPIRLSDTCMGLLKVQT